MGKGGKFVVDLDMLAGNLAIPPKQNNDKNMN